MRRGVEIDYHRRPFSIIKPANRFRNLMGHSRINVMDVFYTEKLATGSTFKRTMAPWPRKRTLISHAKSCLGDLVEVITGIHEKYGPRGFLSSSFLFLCFVVLLSVVPQTREPRTNTWTLDSGVDFPDGFMSLANKPEALSKAGTAAAAPFIQAEVDAHGSPCYRSDVTLREAYPRA